MTNTNMARSSELSAVEVAEVNRVSLPVDFRIYWKESPPWWRGYWEMTEGGEVYKGCIEVFEPVGALKVRYEDMLRFNAKESLLAIRELRS